MRGRRLWIWRGGGCASAGTGLAVWAALTGGAHAQGPEACVYADRNYSHGAIFAGTRCSNGSWINLSETEFRRLYPNGLGSAGAALEAEPASANAAAPVAPPAASTAQPAPPAPAAPPALPQ